MIRIIDSKDRFQKKQSWLHAHWLFSLSSCYDPDNIGFGPLRAYNDDIVQPQCGFPTHLHKNLEIITIVLHGEITLHDNLGNKTILGPNHVHWLYAGTGIRHSEINFTDKPVHYHQLWFLNDQGPFPPEYADITIKSKKWHNRIYPIASGQGYEDTVPLKSETTVYRCDLDTGKKLFYDTFVNRKLFIYILSGSLLVDNHIAKPGDQVRIDLEKQLVIQAKKTCSYILIDLPSCMGWGFSEKTLKGVKVSSNN